MDNLQLVSKDEISLLELLHKVHKLTNAKMAAAMDGKLPIWKHKEDIINTIKTSRAVVVVGETGSGKTTQLPQFLFDAGNQIF